MAAENSSVKSIVMALGANFGIGVAKSIAAVITQSGSMLAEAIHSFADCGNQVLLLFGVKRSKREADENHPLGYGKVIYFWSFIVALMLFSMGGLFSINEGLHKLSSKEPVTSPMVAIIVLSISILLEAFALYAAWQAIKDEKGSMSLWRWFRRSRRSEMVVIVGEDLAAISGLVLALVAVSITAITNNPVYDAIGSISIGVVLILIAIFIGIEIKSSIIGESAGEEYDTEIKEFLLKETKIKRILNFKSLQLGNDVMVAIKAQMIEKKDAAKLVKEINTTEKKIKDKFPNTKWIFFEPDIKD